MTLTCDCGRARVVLLEGDRRRSTNASLAACPRSSVGLDVLHGGQRARGQVAAGGEAVGAEVGQLALVAGDAEVGRGERVERGVVGDEGVGDLVDGAGLGFGHAPKPSRRA